MAIERHHVGKRLSEMVVVTAPAKLIWLAGQVADDASLDVAGQTRQVLASIDRLLAEAGAQRANIVSATIYLSSIGDFPEMNAVWDAWVPQGQTPARATVEAKLAAPGYRVEIQVVATA